MDPNETVGTCCSARMPVKSRRLRRAEGESSDEFDKEDQHHGTATSNSPSEIQDVHQLSDAGDEVQVIDEATFHSQGASSVAKVGKCQRQTPSDTDLDEDEHAPH